MSTHLIAFGGTGFRCSCGEAYDASEQTLRRKAHPARAVASQHQLAALMQAAMAGVRSIVTSCLACGGESNITAEDENTVLAYAQWLRNPCALCGKPPAVGEEQP